MILRRILCNNETELRWLENFEVENFPFFDIIRTIIGYALGYSILKLFVIRYFINLGTSQILTEEPQFDKNM